MGTPMERSRLIRSLLPGALAFWVGVSHAVWLSPVQNVSNDAELSVHPRSAQDPAGNLHLVWIGNDAPRPLHYCKGTWNGVTHTFGAIATIGDAGSWGYATPNIAVSPNGMVAVVW